MVYFRSYDLTRGAYGEPRALPLEGLPSVLFNEFEPENDAAYDYCRVIHSVQWVDEWTGQEWFEAAISGGAEDDLPIARSIQMPFIRGEPVLDLTPDERGGRVHQSLIAKLVAQGWQPVLERRNPWHRVRLKRKKLDPYG